jgi:ATP-dependent Lon protease
MEGGAAKKSADAKEQEKAVTTEVRKPLKVPKSVHFRITPDNLKDYVGPPIYHRDRFYTVPPPPGVSTGLGYLGNGSGAVMPVEVIVSRPSMRVGGSKSHYVIIEHARQRWPSVDWQTR